MMAMGHSFNKQNRDKLVLVQLLVELINFTVDNSTRRDYGGGGDAEMR
jgi:hypothetical protein